ncbi:MAG: hypothetical protein ACK52I_13725 [Pseudomonadota bacterium]|jgi:hypothetical protein
MKHKHETAQPAHLSQVERGVRPLADRLEDHGLQHGERLYYEAAKELRRLHAALEKYEADDVRYLAETQRLRDALATESSRKCATEHDCVWQPHCAHNGKCMRPERPQAA